MSSAKEEYRMMADYAAIVEKLLEDELLQREVYKRLDAFRKTQSNHRRSEEQNPQKSRTTGTQGP